MFTKKQATLTLKRLALELRVDPTKLKLGGSALLLMLGIVDTIGDIDIAVDQDTWAVLLTKYQPDVIERASVDGDRFISVIRLHTNCGEMEIFNKDSIMTGVQRYAETDGWICWSVEFFLETKRRWAREKDLNHVALLEQWLKGTAR